MSGIQSNSVMNQHPIRSRRKGGGAGVTFKYYLLPFYAETSVKCWLYVCLEWNVDFSTDTPVWGELQLIKCVSSVHNSAHVQNSCSILDHLNSLDQTTCSYYASACPMPKEDRFCITGMVFPWIFLFPNFPHVFL